MSLYNDASLAMIPSAVKDGKLYSIRPTDGSGDFTFSRGSNLAATRVDVNGLIEKGRENLLLQSNSFDTTWTTSDTSVTSGQSGYDGSSNAWLLTATSTSNCRINQSISGSGVQTLSVYAKANTADFLAFNPIVGGTNPIAYFDLSNGTVGTTNSAVIDTEIISIGSGWYRCSITFNDTNTQMRILVVDADNSTAVTSGNSIYIQDAQLEVGLVATDYIETTTTTAVSGITEDMPRLDYSGGASCPSLLLEPQRTNLNVFSEDFSNANWDKLNVVTTNYINQVVSPDGYTNADLAIPDTTSNSYHGFQLGSGRPSLTAGTVYTYSIFAKANGYSKIRVQNFSLEVRAQFDLSTGTLINQSGTTSTFITPYGNGWYRVGFTYTQATTISAYWNALVVSNDDNTGNAPVAWAGNGTSSVAFWGSTIEEGSYPSSYIPTYGSAVTRSDDFNNTNDLIDTPYIFEADDNFTLMYEGSFFEENGISNMICGGGSKSLGSTGRSYWWLQNNSNGIRLYGYGEILMATASYTFPSVNTNGKYLVRKADGVIDFFVNGTKLSTTQGTTNLRFDLRSVFWSYNASAYQVSGKAKQFLVFETALTDSEAIALTS